MNTKCEHYPQDVLYVCTCNDFICAKCRHSHQQYHEAKRETHRFQDVHAVRNETLQKLNHYMSQLDSKLKDTRRYKQDIATSKQFTEGFYLIARAQSEIKKLVNAFFKVMEDDFEKKSQSVKAEYEENLNQVENKLSYTLETFQELSQGLQNSSKTALWQKTLDVALGFDFETEMEKIQGEMDTATQEKFYIAVNPNRLDSILEQLHNYIHIANGEPKSPNRSFVHEDVLPKEMTLHKDIPVEELNITKSPTKSPGTRPSAQSLESFQITLDDYFHPECPNKLLHFFEGGSKNLYLVPLQEFESNAPKCHKIELNIQSEIPYRHRSVITPLGEIFLTGGVRGEEELAYTFKLNFVNGALLPKRLMSNPRKSHGLCYMDGYLYAIGGYNITYGALPFCERYDIAQDKWTQLPSLNYRTSSPSVCTFKNKFIFKFGGLEGSSKITEQIEKYDVEKNQWSIYQIRMNESEVNKLTFKIMWLSASCQLNENNIVVFGGCDEENHGSDQTFLVEIVPASDQGNETICNIRKRNALPLPYPAGFWNGQCIINKGKMYSLQNEIMADEPACACEDHRNLLVFDGTAWKTFKI